MGSIGDCEGTTTTMTMDGGTLKAILAALQVSSVSRSGDDRPEFVRAELDSHANMVGLGSHCTVERRTGRSVQVNAFVSAVGTH